MLDSGPRLGLLSSILLHQLDSLGLLPLNQLGHLAVPLVLVAPHLLEVHLVGPVGQPQRADARPHVGEGGVLADAGAAVGLDGAVDDGEGRLRDQHLGLGDLLEGLLGAEVVHRDGRVEDDEARGVDLDARLGDPFEDDAVLAEEFAKGLLGLVVDAHEHPVQSSLGLERLLEHSFAE